LVVVLMPLPVTMTVVGESNAVLIIVITPVTVPDVVGANTTLKPAVWVGPRVMVAGIPTRLKPLPETLNLYRTIVELLELNRLRWAIPLTPTETLPKFRLDGLALIVCANAGVLINSAAIAAIITSQTILHRTHF